MNARRLFDDLHRRYRRMGAELPGGDLVGARGVSMDGWFWRTTDPVTGRVVLVLAGINTPLRGEPWGILGMAGDPDGELHVARLPHVHASPTGMDLTMGGDDGSIRATRDRLEVQLGGARLQLDFTGQRDWQGRLGASSYFQAIPGMNQYWHPWLLGGSVTGSLQLAGGATWGFHDAQLYAEKNWGRGGFPVAWWWGQAQGFEEREACVAFAGGALHLGRPGSRPLVQTDVTGLVVRIPTGEQFRIGNPGTSPVHAEVGPQGVGTDGSLPREGHWVLDGHGHDRDRRRIRLQVQAHVPLAQAFVLPVPLVDEGVLAPGALEAQLGALDVQVHREGRLLWRGSSSMAGLELGGRELAQAELSRRHDDPLPQA